MASSASIPSPKDALTRATTLSQFVISTGAFFLLSSFSSPLVLPSTAFVYSVADNFSVAASSFHSCANHPFKCSACIPEVPPERCFCSRFTSHSILYSVSTESSTGNGSTGTGIFSPGVLYVSV